MRHFKVDGLFLYFIAFLAWLFILMWAQHAQPHSLVITGCSKNIPIKSVVLLGTFITDNGWIVEAYDRNFDGKPDISAYSVGNELKHRTYPVYYEVDMDFDGLADLLYIDKTGVGKCDDIILLSDYDQPGDHVRPSEMLPYHTEGM